MCEIKPVFIFGSVLASPRQQCLKFHSLFDIGNEILDLDSFLFHRIAVTDGYAAVVCGFEVVGNAEGSADFVLAAVTLTDGAGFVVVNHEVLCEHIVDLPSLFAELFGEGKNGSLDGRERGVEVHNGTNVLFTDLFFVVSVNEECESDTVSAERGLDNVGNVFFTGNVVEEFHGFSAVILMLGQVVVGTVSDAPKLTPAEREEIFEVGGRLGVEAELLGAVVAETEIFLVHAERVEEVCAVVLPVCEPFEVGAGTAEEFKLHLFEFADTENEVTGGDFVTEGLTDLRDTEGHFLSGGSCDVLEVHEDTLRGFGTEVELTGGVLGNTLESLEHQVELTDIGEIVAAAVGASDIVFLDVIEKLCVGPAAGIVGKIVFCCIILDELVGSVTCLAGFAVHERVSEALEVTGSNPGFLVHDDRAVKTNVVFGFLNEFLPPCLLDVVFEFYAERTEIPAVCETAVDFRAGIYDAAVFAERDDLFHCLFCLFHFDNPFVYLMFISFHIHISLQDQLRREGVNDLFTVFGANAAFL